MLCTSGHCKVSTVGLVRLGLGLGLRVRARTNPRTNPDPGRGKELLADERRAGRAELDPASAALYEEAKAFYRQANALCEDPASRRGYMRVQAKVHPDMEWVPQPEGPGLGDGALGGFARAKKSVNLDELPPGPR